MLRCLIELGIDSTPRSTCRGLIDGEGLTVGGHRGLHVANGCSGLGQFEGLTIHFDGGILGIQSQRIALSTGFLVSLSTQERIHRIHTVDRRIPGLGTFLHQEPALHLLDGLLILWGEALQGLDSHGLGGNLIVVPAIAGTWRIVIATHLLTIDGILLQRLDILKGTLRISLGEDHGRQGLFIDALPLDILLQQAQQIVVGCLYLGWQFPAVEGGEVKPLEGLERWERGFMTFLLPFLHLFYHLHNLRAHEFEGTGEHLLRRGLCSCHIVQTDQHLTHGHSHIERARHTLPPGPGTIAEL